MNEKLKDKINKYLIIKDFCEEIEISKEKYDSLPEEEKTEYTKAAALNEDYDMVHVYRKDVPDSLTDKELEIVFSINTIREIEEIKKDVHTIKNAVVFFAVLTAINLFLAVILPMIAMS